MKRIIVFFALGMSVAYAQNLCTVSDGACAADKTQDQSIFESIGKQSFTASVVFADSCTVCGKNPETGR